MTALRPTIDRAGKYSVVQSPCPYQHSFLANMNAPPTGILHTTEGGWPGSMAVFKVHFSPHFIVGLNAEGKPEIAQLVPIGYGALACKAHNNGSRVEIEMVANSKETLWLPDDATLDALASLMVVCRDEWGIPLSRPWSTGDYGRAGHNPHRSAGRFGTVAGWFGHGDMPDPDSHWDPGNLNWDAVFARAKNLVAPADQDRTAEVASAVLATPPRRDPPTVPASTATPTPITLSVSDAQRALNAAGYKPALDVDGRLGPKTRDALSRFQSSKSIFADGTLSAATVAALQSFTA